METTMNWQPGQWGKGLILDGRLHTWPVEEETGSPHHYEYYQNHAGVPEDQAWQEYPNHVPITIGPEGWYTSASYPEGNPDVTRFAQAGGGMKYVSDPNKWDRKVFGNSLQDILDRPCIGFTTRLGSTSPEVISTDKGVVIFTRDHLARALLETELAYHGYRLASIDMEAGVKTASWEDIMQKAKRMLDANQVILLRNGTTNIVGTVQGDHGRYEVEIGRQDPASRVITNWSCGCPWAQFSFDRTRQWKKYEQRPCSHCLALYWKSLQTPVDDADEQPEGGPPVPGPKPGGQGGPPSLPGQPGGPPAPGAPKGGPGGGPAPIGVREAPSGPRTFMPNGDMFPAEQGQQPTPQAPPQGGQPQGPPGAGGAQPQGVIPPFPGQQMQLWEQWQGPGTTDGGQESPPWAVSVPGAKPTTPFSPIQSPGTYSKMVWSAQYQPDQIVQLLTDEYGAEQGGSGQYVLVSARRPDGSPRTGMVRGQDETTGWVECMFSLDENGPGEARYAVCYLDPSQIRPSQAMQPGQVGPRRVYK